MKKRNDRIRRKQLLRWGSTLILFIILNAIIRLPLLPVNQAEYTDGILQVNQFTNQTGIYPPLYTAICWPFAQLLGPLWAGRLVSTLFSIAAVIPLYLLALRCFGMRAALYTAMIYTVAPTALRWSPRVMTEATFTFFFWFACERIMAAQGAQNEKKANWAIFLACVLGALAALTRYQGLMLIIPIIAVAAWRWKSLGTLPWKGLAGLPLFGLPFLWSAYAGNIHGTQFAERAGDNAIMTIILNAEPFILLMPFFLTYPVALLVLIGLNCGRWRPRMNPLPLTIYTLVVLILAQSLFGSFQERYLLPLFGLLFAWGGLGMAVSDDRLRRRHSPWRPYVPIITLTWSLLISVLVLIGSRGAFGDISRASRVAAEAAGENRILTNEIYRAGPAGEPPIAGDKVAFFARRDATFISEPYYEGRLSFQPGDILVMSSAYGANQQMEFFQSRYELELLDVQESVITPVFPDLMSIPGTGQSPFAWFYRYTPQHFETQVWRVLRARGMR